MTIAYIEKRLTKCDLQKQQRTVYLPFLLQRIANLDVFPGRKVEIVNIWMFVARLLMVSLLLCCYVSFHLGYVVDKYYNNQSIHFSGPIDPFNPQHETLFYNVNPIIHIVNTRFMQEQAELYYLSFARLHLFETFCFPSMVHQTIQPKNTTSSIHNNNDIYKFLWIIKVGKIHEMQVVCIALLYKHLRAVTPHFMQIPLHFVWCSNKPRIDPKINETIKNRLVQLLSPYPNFYLVGSNSNFGIGRKGGSWRTGEAGEDILQSSTPLSLRSDPIYTGSIPLLHFAHRMREERIVLETRLDADDGLPASYLETLQEKAWMEWRYDGPITSSKSNLTYDNNNHTVAKWLYWCVTNVLNWYPTVITMTNTTGDSKSSQDGKDIHANRDPGSLFFSHDSTICYSPGLTFGLPVGEVYYPRVDHYNLLFQRNRFHCTSTEEVEKDCIQPLPPSIYAIRSRTPTSAGFKDLINISVSTTTTSSSSTTSSRIRKNKAAGQREQLVSLNVNGWDLVQQQYNISQHRAHETNLYFHRNLLLILQDNWIGQCSSGHSCKHKTKEELAYMIQSLPGGSKVYESLQKKKKKKDLTHEFK